MDKVAAAAAGHAGALIPVFFAAAFAVIAVAVFFSIAARPALTLSVIVALVIWVIGENFGGILTGQATDQNTGPLIVLVAIAFWPLSIRQQSPLPRITDPKAGEPLAGEPLRNAGTATYWPVTSCPADKVSLMGSAAMEHLFRHAGWNVRKSENPHSRVPGW